MEEKIKKEQPKVVAVSFVDFQQFGCPHCGYRSGNAIVSCNGARVWHCGNEECQNNSIILEMGLTKSTIGVGSNGSTIFPELQKHPRKGIPVHGRLDAKPEGGGEFFNSRGIGSDFTPGCFMCGGESGFHENISAFVQCKESGERVVEMFRQGVRLDYREHEPDRVQVKIGACKKHSTHLEHLNKLVGEGIITEEMIKEVISR